MASECAMRQQAFGIPVQAPTLLAPARRSSPSKRNRKRGWVDHFGCTVSSFDNLSRRTADGIRSTTELALSVTSDLDSCVRCVSQNFTQEVGQAVLGARREVPRLAEVGIAGAQAFSADFFRWSQGLLGAAARALGDVEHTGHHGGAIRGEALRNSLRNRGGIRLVGKPDMPPSLKNEEVVDAFLLNHLSELLDISHEAPALDVGIHPMAQATTGAITSRAEMPIIDAAPTAEDSAEFFDYDLVAVSDAQADLFSSAEITNTIATPNAEDAEDADCVFVVEADAQAAPLEVDIFLPSAATAATDGRFTSASEPADVAVTPPLPANNEDADLLNRSIEAGVGVSDGDDEWTLL